MTQQTALAPRMDLADGIYEGLTFEQYSAIDALNGSSIVHMRRSPMYYRHMKDNPPESSPAQVLGTATHQLILEPSRTGDFAVWGEIEEQKVRRGKVWDQFCELNKGAFVVTKRERDAMVGCMVAVRRNPVARKHLAADGPTELSMVWTDSVSGRRFKGRIDKLVPHRNTIVDLKTCRSCEPNRFGAQAYTLGYHIKMAMYADGWRKLVGKEPHVKMVAVESKAPYESAVYRVTKDVLLQGMEELDALIKTLDTCEETNHWPPAMQEESDLLLPAWATSTNEEDFSLEGLEIE